MSDFFTGCFVGFTVASACYMALMAYVAHRAPKAEQ